VLVFSQLADTLSFIPPQIHFDDEDMDFEDHPVEEEWPEVCRHSPETSCSQNESSESLGCSGINTETQPDPLGIQDRRINGQEEVPRTKTFKLFVPMLRQATPKVNNDRPKVGKDVPGVRPLRVPTAPETERDRQEVEAGEEIFFDRATGSIQLVQF